MAFVSTHWSLSILVAETLATNVFVALFLHTHNIINEYKQPSRATRLYPTIFYSTRDSTDETLQYGTETPASKVLPSSPALATKQNKRKQNKAKQNKTKQNKTKQNKTKQ